MPRAARLPYAEIRGGYTHQPHGRIIKPAAPSTEVIFRLYRGDHSSNLELFYEVAAVPGQSKYRVGDLPQSNHEIYELRIARRGDTQRREVTLGTRAGFACGQASEGGGLPAGSL